ncbi:MAG: DUF202 domain-containing protein, partial [Pirellulaceae bacterium]|nr:DUF202 domain-containing protein [Pirellulaceae bacterium]
RTGLAMMGFGFVVARFGLFLREMAAARGEVPGPALSHGISLWIGTALVLLGVLVNLLAAWQHRSIIRRLQPGIAHPVRASALSLAVAILLAAIGVAMCGYLLVVR